MSVAIEHANRVLDWHENLGPDDLPPEWMWHLPEELETHFAEVKRRRDEKSSGDSSGDETVPMMKNSWGRD